MDQPEDIIICSGDLVRTNFSSSLADASYSWTIADPVLGMSASGTGNLNFATEAHFGAENIKRTVKVKATKGGCVSEEKEFKLILKPRPQLVQQAELVIFPGESIPEIAFADNSGGNSVISWTASNASLIGLPANSGTGSVPSFVANDNTSGGTIESTIIVNALWNGCEGSAMKFTVKLKPRPILAAVNDIVACPAELIELAFKSNVSGTTFSWTNSNTASGLAAAGSGNISFTTAENFSGQATESLITVIPVSPAGFEGEPVEFLITVQPVPVIETVADFAVCPGELVSIDFLSNTEGANFYWENDNALIGLAENGEGSFEFKAAENFSASTMSATVTYFAGRAGCESEAKSFIISLYNQPVPDPVAPSEICSGESFTPPAFSDDTQGSSEFFWTIDQPALLGLSEASGIGNLPVLEATDNLSGAPLLITVRYYSILNGCKSESLNYEISLLPAPVLENTDINACANEAISIRLQANTGGGESYSWENTNPGIGLSATSGSGELIEFVALNDTEEEQRGTITVSITKDGCTFPGQSFDIIVKPLPEVSNPSTDLVRHICSGDAVIFDPVSNLEGVEFAWTASSDLELEGFTEAGEGPIRETILNRHNNTTATIIYTITPVRKDGVSCVGTPVELVVYLAPVPELSLPQLEYSVCNGEELMISPVSASNIEGTVFEWEAGPNASGAVSGKGDQLVQSLFNKNNEADTITYTISAIAGDCRSAAQTVKVYVRPYATVNAGKDFAVCEGDPVVVEGIVGGSASYGTWSGGKGTFQNAAALVTTYIPDPSEIGTSIQLVLTTNGPAGPCSATADTVNVIIEPLPDLAIVNLPGVYCTQNDAFLLEGYPANGTFSGDGVVFDEELKRYYFDPKISGIGLYRISYSFQNIQGCTGTTSGLIDVSSGANSDFNVLTNNEFICETQARIGLTPLVQGGVFDGPGVEISGGRAWFNPSAGNLGENMITYTIFDQKSGCTTSSSQMIYVHAKPAMAIEYENLCIDNGVQFGAVFQSISEGDEILSYHWSFGDGFSSTEVAPVRQYSSPGLYEVTLKIQSALSCDVTEIKQQVVVSNIVELDFDFENICGNDTTRFIPENIDRILNYSNAAHVSLEYLWDFGDPASGAANTATEAHSGHKFSGFGEYEVSLTVRNDLGCEETVSRRINIVPAITSFPHSQQFKGDVAATGWFAEGTNSSWQYGVPAGNVINSPAVAGTNVWATRLGGSYQDNERSYVVSPCFDLSSIEQPMISMNLFLHAEDGRDGAVLQYSKDGGRSWSALGSKDRGLGWYKHTNIVADPAGQGIGNTGWSGWSGAQGGWQEVAYSLDELRSEGSFVIFRIAFASDDRNVGDHFEGVALDDVYIGSRRKKVLVENFTNSHAAGFGPNVVSFSDSLNKPDVANDVVLLQYHTAFPQPDTLYLRNPDDPGARGLFYGIYKAPQIVIDGVKDSLDRSVISSNTLSWIDRQSLSRPLAGINILIDELSEAQLLKGTVELSSPSPLGKELILYINAVEVEAEGGGMVLRNVLKKILPESSGIYLSNLKAAQTFEFEWNVTKDFEPGNLGVVAYLQEKETKEVLQSSFSTVASSMKGGKLTAIGDINAELKKLEVYPNPADDFIRLRTNGRIAKDLRYELIHLDGTILAKGRLNAGMKDYEIESRYLNNGLYILRLFTEKSVAVNLKVMVMHRK